MQIQNLLTAYKERLDKENFVKNLLRDNLLVDIYNRSKKLHIEVEQRRVAFILIQAEYEKDQNLLEATKRLSQRSRFRFYYSSGREEYRLCNTSEWE